MPTRVLVVPTWSQPTSCYEARTHRLKKGDVTNPLAIAYFSIGTLVLVPTVVVYQAIGI